MTVKFCFGNRRKDGTKNLKIRLKHKGRDKKIALEGVYFDPKYWDDSLNRVKATHPSAPAYNEIIQASLKKMQGVKDKLQLKQIDFDTAYRILASKNSIDSIFEFLELHCDDKSVEWKRNTIGIFRTFQSHLGLEDVTFNDITYQNLQKLKNKSKSKGNTKETYNTYMRHIRAAYKYAVDNRITYREFKFPNELLYKVNKHNKKLETHQHADILSAIKKIRIKSNHRTAKKSAIRDLEAVGFWMLKFAMRGLYAKDMVTLTSFDSDYNYDYRIKYLSANAQQERQIIHGSPEYIDHKRHKTGNIMRIWVTLPPIGSLIFILKRLVPFTHPHVSYLSIEDIMQGTGIYSSKPNYDILRIFKHDPEQTKVDQAIWNNFNKRLKNLGLFSFKSARKSFNTTALHLGIPADLRRELLGHTDSTIQGNYTNYNDTRLVKAVQEAHIEILKSFKMVDLYDAWVYKINELFDKFDDMHIGASSDIVYGEQKILLEDMLNSNKTLIDDVQEWKYFKKIEKLNEPKEVLSKQWH